VTADADPAFLRQFTGHVESGFGTQTEPILGAVLSTNTVTVTNSPPPLTSPLSLTNVLASLASISGTNPPTLYAAFDDTNFCLVYLLDASNFVVETSPDLSPGSWTSLNATSTIISNCIVVPAPLSPSNGFFRLRQ
jgi:hypothetical protein